MSWNNETYFSKYQIDGLPESRGAALSTGPISLKEYYSKSLKSTIMQEIIDQILAQMELIKTDIVKSDNKAAQARVRKATLALEKLGKQYRRASLDAAKK